MSIDETQPYVPDASPSWQTEDRGVDSPPTEMDPVEARALAGEPVTRFGSSLRNYVRAQPMQSLVALLFLTGGLGYALGCVHRLRPR